MKSNFDGYYEDQMKKRLKRWRPICAGAGRTSNPHVDPITVSYYGVLRQSSKSRMQIPEAKLLVITPWDSSMLKKLACPASLRYRHQSDQ